MDKNIHGTAILGVRNGSAKLTEEVVRQIKRLIVNRTPLAEIARLHNVSVKAIGHIKSGRNWGWVDA